MCVLVRACLHVYVCVVHVWMIKSHGSLLFFPDKFIITKEEHRFRSNQHKYLT